MNFESLAFDELATYKQLYAYLQKKQEKDGEGFYIFLDETQQVEAWREFTTRSMLQPVDIYLTGSNAYLLSSELSTLLAGKYVEIPMQPLFFKEYLDFVGGASEPISDRFNDYLTYGD